MGGLFRAYPEWAEIEPCVTPMAAGDGVFINGMLAHGAGPNMTTRPRRAMAFVLMPDGARYNGIPSALPEEYVNSLEVGDLLNDDRHLPVLYPMVEL